MADDYSTSGDGRALKMFIGVAAVVFVITLGITAAITFLQPQAFAGIARIKIAIGVPDSAKTNAAPDALSDEAQFLQTQAELIRSEAVLGRVIDELDLTVAWGKRYAGGERLKKGETLALLRNCVEPLPVASVTSVDIQVFRESAEEAAKIANAIAKAYQNHRLQWRREDLEIVLTNLQWQYEMEDKSVRTNQAALDLLRSAFTLTNGEAAALVAEVRRWQREQLQYETKLAEKTAQLTSLSLLPPEKQRDAVAVALGKEADFGAVLREYNLAASKLVQSGFETNGAAHQEAKAAYDEVTHKLDAEVKTALVELTNRVTQLQAARAEVKAELERAKSNVVAQAEANRRYQEIEPTLRELEKRRAAIGDRRDAKQAALATLKSDVEIVEPATPAKEPARPDKVRNLVYGAGGGVMLGLIIGALVAWLASPSRGRPRA